MERTISESYYIGRMELLKRALNTSYTDAQVEHIVNTYLSQEKIDHDNKFNSIGWLESCEGQVKKVKGKYVIPIVETYDSKQELCDVYVNTSLPEQTFELDDSTWIVYNKKKTSYLSYKVNSFFQSIVKDDLKCVSPNNINLLVADYGEAVLQGKTINRVSELLDVEVYN